MRILWYSNGSHVPSGYGTQTRVWLPRIAALGHDVAVAAFHGLQGAPAGFDGVMTYPASGEDPWSQDTLPGHYGHHQADLLITLMDAWVLDPARLGGMNVAHWLPVDCSPLSVLDQRVLSGGGRPVAMSQFGKRQLGGRRVGAAVCPARHRHGRVVTAAGPGRGPGGYGPG